MNENSKVVIYDLDGTLVDSIPGISQSFRYTLASLKFPNPSDEQIRKAIGPGLHKSLEAFIGQHDLELIDKAVKIYREHHDNIGYKATTFYPGLRELVSEVNSWGAAQFVASMKSDTIVRPILTYLDSLSLFLDAIGSSPDGKTKTKAEMLHFLSLKYRFSLENAVLVGDTAHDARAAKEANVDFFGVTFGYGTRAELEEVGWGEFFDTAGELREALRKRLNNH